MFPIIGVRYWCENCVDFNLCEVCAQEECRHHDRLHVFLRVKHPLPRTLPAAQVPVEGSTAQEAQHSTAHFLGGVLGIPSPLKTYSYSLFISFSIFRSRASCRARKLAKPPKRCPLRWGLPPEVDVKRSFEV